LAVPSAIIGEDKLPELARTPPLPGLARLGSGRCFMAASVTGGPGSHVLDLAAVGSSRELSEIDGRLHILEGLLDALGRIDDVNRAIQLTANRRAAVAALQQEPFGYTEPQAEAVLEMPMSWQCAEGSQRLKAEHDSLRARRAEVRERVSEFLSLHWFG